MKEKNRGETHGFDSKDNRRKTKEKTKEKQKNTKENSREQKKARENKGKQNLTGLVVRVSW